MGELFTLKEIAKQLDVPESNLRYYRNKIGDFLPSVGKGRKRRYLPETMEVFRRAIELLENGMNLDMVYKHLASEHPPETESIGTVSQQELIDRIADRVFEKFRESDLSVSGFEESFTQELNSSKDETAGLKNENQELKTEIENLKESLGSTEMKLDEAIEKVNIKTSEIEKLEKTIAEEKNNYLIAENRIEDVKKELEEQKSRNLELLSVAENADSRAGQGADREEFDREIAGLKNELETAKSEINLLRDQLKEKNHIIDIQRSNLINMRKQMSPIPTLQMTENAMIG